MRAALASDGPPKDERTPAGSAVDAFEDAIRVQLKKTPTMPATVIAERVGWTGGMTVFSERVRSCVRRICRRIRQGAPAMTAAISRSATCGFHL